MRFIPHLVVYIANVISKEFKSNEHENLEFSYLTVINMLNTHKILFNITDHLTLQNQIKRFSKSECNILIPCLIAYVSIY